MTHLDQHYLPAPGFEEPFPEDLHTAHVRYDNEVWTDTHSICVCSSFGLANMIASMLRSHTGQ